MPGAQRWWLRFVAAVVPLTALLSGPPIAVADGKLALGGGAGIVVEGSYCTLTTIGHDNTGALVGFTAAHCGGPGAQVVAEGTDTTVGAVVAANGDARLDYAVIKFDPGAVIPIANFAGFAINGIGGNPEWHQPACKLSAATGHVCSDIASIPSPSPRAKMHAFFQPGDDGGPVTSDDLLIGMIRNGFYVPGDLQGAPPVIITRLILFSAILDDVNAGGGPGAGFTPVPA